MSTRKRKSYLLKDLNAVYTEFYSDASPHANFPFVKAVFDSLKILLSECEIGDKVLIVGFGSFEKCPPKKGPGHFKHFVTKKPIKKEQKNPRIKFTPSPLLKALVADKKPGGKK